MLGVLMGFFGVGKIIFLDVFVQRKIEGVIKGSIMVDGCELFVFFQRNVGYCEQFDVYELYVIVWEVFEFSVFLWQFCEVFCEEKLCYVDIIIDFFELYDLVDILIGCVGMGLFVEQCKCVIIGVEFVVKFLILIFLDEFILGFDGQFVYNMVCFFCKFVDVG